MFQGKRNLFVQQRGLLSEGQFLMTAGTQAAAQPQPTSQPSPSPAPSPQPLRQPDAVVSPQQQIHHPDAHSANSHNDNDSKGHPSPRKRLRFADDVANDEHQAAVPRGANHRHSASSANATATPPTLRASMMRSWIISSIIARPSMAAGVSHRFWIIATDDLNQGPTQMDPLPRHNSSTKRSAASSSGGTASSVGGPSLSRQHEVVQEFVDEVKRKCISTANNEHSFVVVEVDVGQLQLPPRSRLAPQTPPSVETLVSFLKEHLSASTCASPPLEGGDLTFVWLLRSPTPSSITSSADQLINLRAACRHFASSSVDKSTVNNLQQRAASFGAVVVQVQLSSHARAVTTHPLSNLATTLGSRKAHAPASSHSERVPTLLDVVSGNSAAIVFDSVVAVPMFVS
ncbi:Hypothetical protein, putative [Bodo saltans]|uniref:Uncharacterized protein n=1 Tax=Bodo saltans TaxID=75058 RepID=A0A0S4IUG0_BODSA|nr:Hypothetical protein, putative [Bodo saltans]|eukprot:CUF97422.1 Hypothetical protein, putative [Bodo saltans]